MVLRLFSPLARARLRLADRPQAQGGASPSLAERLRQLPDDNSGSIAIVFSLILVALCLFVGAAVDLGRWLQARHQTIAAMDAAVLAGGRVLQLDEKDVAGARAAAHQYYTENTKGRTEVIEDTITFNTLDDNTAFGATGNAYLKTSFLNFARISKLPLLNTSEAHFSKAVLRAGGKSNTEVEISMMLDVTGSMKDTSKIKKISALKEAATDLVNIVISESAHANPVRVALVPFADSVRLPSSANSKARGNPAGTVSLSYKDGRTTKTAIYRRTDCVVERTGADKYTDAAPGSGNYVTTMYNSKGSCLSSKNELMPLSNDKTALKNRIDGLQVSGNTAGQVGTAWAWYTLSPNWNTLWSSASAASGYGGNTRKIAILMTDGEYNFQYDAAGVATGSNGAGSAANGDSTTQARALCTAIKAKGITVYTVGFALGKDSTASKTLEHCATDPSMAYTPESGEELQQAFRDIALKINQLYLTH